MTVEAGMLSTSDVRHGTSAVHISTIDKQLVVGVAFIDTDTHTIRVAEFLDDHRLSDLTEVLCQLNCEECVIPATEESCPLVSILEQCKVKAVHKPRAVFSSRDIDQDLGRLCGSSLQHYSEEVELSVAMGAVSALIHSLSLLNHSTTFTLSRIALPQYLRLDSSAIRALNLFPSASDVSKSSSLFGLLDRCRTSMGSRLLSKWIKQPLLSIQELNKRLNIVEAFVADSVLCDSLHQQHLKGIPDLNAVTKKIADKRIKLKDCVSLYNFSVALPALVDALSEYRDVHCEVISSEFSQPLSAIVEQLTQFQSLIEATVDLDAAANRHEYIVKASFDPKLQQIGKAKKHLAAQMEELRVDIEESLGLDEGKLKEHYAAQHGHHFRLARKDEKKLRGQAVISLETRKDGVRFTTKAMTNLSEEFEELSSEYVELQKHIVLKITQVVESYAPVLEELSVLLPRLDVFVAFAVVSSESLYTRPVLHPLGTRVMLLNKARHPCLEAQEFVNFIPNSIEMKDESRFQILTGPNMAGKSTYIRTAGLIVLMAQIGCFVPCSEAQVSLVDCLLLRVGAGDCAGKGISTFMAEMLEANSILKNATENSMVIVDELGRGTSTCDGFGIAWALSEYIIEDIKCFSFFATHFHELTALSELYSSAVNKHVTALTTEDSLTMLYEVRDGACDRSFGIHVAKLARFPDSVISAAKRKVSQLECFVPQDLARKSVKLDPVVSLVQEFARNPVPGEL